MLEHLLVAENQLESVPDSLGKLRKLKVLDLSENLIGALHWGGELPDLTRSHSSPLSHLRSG